MAPQTINVQSDDLCDEEALVAQMKLSDEDLARSAFGQIYGMYAADLFRFAYGYLRDRSAAEDMVAEVCLTVWSRRAVWTPRYGVRAYLFTAIQRSSLNALRGEQRAARRHAAAYEDDVLETGGVAEPDVHLSGENAVDIQGAVQLAIAALPEETRRIAELRWRDGFSPVEIAAILGINRAAVDNRISRLVKRLRTQLSGVR